MGLFQEFKLGAIFYSYLELELVDLCRGGVNIRGSLSLAGLFQEEFRLGAL